MRRCVQDRNRTLYGLILKSTQRLSVLRLMQLFEMAPLLLTCFHLVSARSLSTTHKQFSPVCHQLSHSDCKENRFSVGSLLGKQPQPRYSWSQRYRNPQTCVRKYRNSFKLEVISEAGWQQERALWVSCSKGSSLRLPNLEVINTAALDVIRSTTIDKAGMTPCNNEEADTHIFVHAKHASVNCMKILIRTVNTIAFVLAIAFLQKLDVEELWVATCRCTR